MAAYTVPLVSSPGAFINNRIDNRESLSADG